MADLIQFFSAFKNDNHPKPLLDQDYYFPTHWNGGKNKKNLVEETMDKIHQILHNFQGGGGHTLKGVRDFWENKQISLISLEKF